MTQAAPAALRFRRRVTDAHGYVREWSGAGRPVYLLLDGTGSTRPMPGPVLQALARHLEKRDAHAYAEADGWLSSMGSPSEMAQFIKVSDAYPRDREDDR